MMKNYVNSSANQKNRFAKKPKKEVVSFLLNYSKSLEYKKSKTLDQLRFDKN